MQQLHARTSIEKQRRATEATLTCPRGLGRDLARRKLAHNVHHKHKRMQGFVVRAAAELEEIDPITGNPISVEPFRAQRPQEMVQGGRFKWAYRTAPGVGETDGKAPVLLLHGIGSNSYCWRDILSTFSENGHTCYAPDWIGHGGSEKPSPSEFAYDEDAYVSALEDFVQAIGLKGPYFVVTHGFVLGQYGMLWALKHAADIEKLVVLNTPVGMDTKLRPELAVYKNPLAFLRPKPDAKFAADLYNAAGLAYVINYNDAQAYDIPYQEEPQANVALAATMDKCDWKGLLSKVDSAYCSWKVPTALLFGNSDPFLDVRDALKFLDTKRTSMQLTSVEGKLGHMPQEDYADSFSGLLLKYFDGGDITVKGINKIFKKERKSFKESAP